MKGTTKNSITPNTLGVRNAAEILLLFAFFFSMLPLPAFPPFLCTDRIFLDSSPCRESFGGRLFLLPVPFASFLNSLTFFQICQTARRNGHSRRSMNALCSISFHSDKSAHGSALRKPHPPHSSGRQNMPVPLR